MSAKYDDLVFMKFDPGKSGITGTGEQPDILFRDDRMRQVLEEHAEHQRARVAARLGIRLNDVGTLGWLESGDRKNDVKGIRTFVVHEGDKAGQYYLDYNANGGEILKKFDGRRYVQEGAAMPRPATREERGRQNQADIEKIKRGINPRTGELFNVRDLASPPPGSNATVIQNYNNRRVEDDFRWNQWLQYFNSNAGDGR